MKRVLTAVLLTTLAMASTVSYGQARHRHVRRARPDVRRAIADAERKVDEMSSDVGSASSRGNAIQLRALFAKGASANYMYENGLQPLILAAEGAHADAVRLLIAHGAHLWGADNGGSSALDNALSRKRYTTDPVLRAKYDTVIAVLVNAGAQADDKAVLEAARTGDTARLQKLLAKDARVNFPLGNPLVLAAQGAHVEAVRVLLKVGAPYFRSDPNGTTVLDNAEVQQGRAADPTTRAKYAQIITLLKKAGALEAWQRAELNAINREDVARLRLLFAHGASANFVDNDVGTPLMLAAEGAHVEAVRFLLAHGANVNAEDNRGRTSLDIAEFYDKAWAKERPDPVRRAKYAQTLALLAQVGGQKGSSHPKTPENHQRFDRALQPTPQGASLIGERADLDAYKARTRPMGRSRKGG